MEIVVRISTNRNTSAWSSAHKVTYMSQGATAPICSILHNQNWKRHYFQVGGSPRDTLWFNRMIIQPLRNDIFNNYSPKAKLILLNNPRDEVEGIIQQY